MATTQVFITDRGLEDPLSLLPCARVLAYRPGDIIYSPDQPSTGLYLVIDGKVKVCCLADDKREFVIEIYRTEEFFGESALLSLPRRGHAIALEPAKLMTWTNTEVEELLEKRPRLSVALLQMVVQRELDFSNRIASFVVDKTSRRLARSLIWLSDRLGSLQADGSVRMAPFTQKLLSEYIGTSREAVSYLMNEFRRYGYLDYSGREITLSREALMEWLRDPHGVFGPSDTAGAREEVRRFCAGSAGI